MRLILILLIFSFSFVSKAQNKYIGVWKDHFITTLKVNADTTYLFSWHFDISGGWASGKWQIRNDTIYFNYVPVYDTLRYFDKVKGRQVDSLVLSTDPRGPKLILKGPDSWVTLPNQGIQSVPDKLFLKGKRLYVIDIHGKLHKSKLPAMSMIRTKKKYHTWYLRA